ncbi:MAG TPA: YchJ family metal-binding protein [Fibrobacteria bacterium]|nr:YchJ family metal-binding protein [Fibrobacteria bacterium]
MAACPCCSGLPYEECCRPILAGSPAPTAEALVRSRYTAFAVRSLDHVENTHAPEIRDDFNRAEAERLAEECEWKNLRIHKAIEDGDQASVEYVMEVRKDGNTIIKGVKSDFRRENGQWLFASTKPAPQLAHALSTKVSRNDPCPCASGKKYKKCCGA